MIKKRPSSSSTSAPRCGVAARVSLVFCLSALPSSGAFSPSLSGRPPAAPLAPSCSRRACISASMAGEAVQSSNNHIFLRRQELGLGGTGIYPLAAKTRVGRSSALLMTKAGETDHNPSQSVLAPGGLPTVLLDDPPPDDVYEKAIGRTLAWVGGAVVFAVGLFALAGPGTAEEFCAGYLVEQSLSVDNLFVFLLLFDYFKVPLAYQDRVLNWGIYGAIVMRAVLIGVGAAALQNFHAILLVFAGILVYSSANVLLGGEDEEEDMSENSIVKISRNLIDSTDEYDGDRFFTLVEGVKKATPLFICMVAVEISDVVFAVDSIPAVFGVTENPLVVFTSNMFAIMGLRSLYTILSKAASDLEYLEPAVAVVLGFIGSKMIAEYFGYTIATEVALGFVATVLSGGIALSVWSRDEAEPEEEAT